MREGKGAAAAVLLGVREPTTAPEDLQKGGDVSKDWEGDLSGPFIAERLKLVSLFATVVPVLQQAPPSAAELFLSGNQAEPPHKTVMELAGWKKF